ncbi:MAG TPA: S66 peptidase family protein [Candidatus Sulfomarinibacteraceae bacterium]|nr:S66 peptidase family protein [Candidatus Sulfomarinibacteraceae bacterium]
MQIPPKLQPDDTICVVSPAESLAQFPADQLEIARDHLASLGLHTTIADHARERDMFDSSPVASRVADLHAAFADPHVHGILSTIGGYNSNQLLRYLDYDLIGEHPKVFCGFSDITALATAIYAKTGLVTYSGPHFLMFAMQRGIAYTLNSFHDCVMKQEPLTVMPAETWSDDAWYLDQEDRTFVPNPGYVVINEGRARGTLLGGHLGTFTLLHGTEYMPPLAGSILLFEEDDEATPAHFDRLLQAVIHQPGFADVQGLIIGRFQRATQMRDDQLPHIVRSKPELARMPIVAQASFGHTTPQFTFPIGGKGELVVEGNTVRFTITAH